ncbi:hypothetical protein D3C81_1498630 [compost metagenome]
MDVEDSVVLVFGGLGEGGHFTMAGVVDQVVERLAAKGCLQRRLHLFTEFREALDVGDIQLDGDGLSAYAGDLIDHRCGFFGSAAISDDHIAAMLGDAEGGVAAQATAGTGHERDI